MILRIIKQAISSSASDIHITYGSKPLFRLDGKLNIQEEFEACTDELIKEFINEIINKEELETLERNKQVDFAINTQWARCRVNIFMQRGHFDIVLRLIDFKIRSLKELGLSSVLKELAGLNSGLVLISGVTGSGKSTTLAAIIDYINENFSKNIITLEDPIEYVHKSKKSIVRQREVGKDVVSFEEGIRASLREDPDVLLVGEMRDLETISSAITLAETGHLVLATLHTRNATESIDRIIDVFHPNHHQQIRVQLAHVLEGVIYQMLIPRKNIGRVACLEILRTTLPIRNMIKTKDNISKIKDEIYANKSKLGTQTITQALADLYLEGIIDKQTGLRYSEDEGLFCKLLNENDI